MVRKGVFLGCCGALISWALVACASTSSLLVTRFSREHSCQADQVRVREAGGNEYEAEGCGQRARYVCNSFAGNKNSVNAGCAEQGVVPQALSEPAKRQPAPGLEEPPR